MCNVEWCVCRYLFWVEEGEESGIYRMDLSTYSRPLTDARPTLLVSMNSLHTLTIDCINYRIFFPNNSANTMMSIDMDGSDLLDVRTNAHSPDFVMMSSVAQYRGVFYWANKHGKVLMEEYDPERRVYHHNEMMFRGNSFTGLNIWHSVSQPTPSM